MPPIGLRVYGNAWNERSAGQYYRIRVPLKAMHDQNLAEVFVDDPFQDQVKRVDYVFGADVHVHFLTAGKAIHKQFQVIRDMKPARNGFGTLKAPPIIVFDVDDDIESISPLNPKYSTLGTRDENGNLLPPRMDICIRFDDAVEHGLTVGERPEDDSVFLWRHGLETPHGSFDSARNVVNHAQVRKAAATAHAITCTGEHLAQVARRWNPRVYVYPNSMWFPDHLKIDVRRPADEVRVLWQGGYSHFADFYPLRDAFGEAHRRMPHVKWITFGTQFPFVMDRISPFRLEHHPWVAHQLFHLKYGTLAFDINIAPLADTRFNLGKSAIKWYEAAAMKLPTLAQRTGPYLEIEDGVTGLLFSTPQEFVEKLEMLVKDDGLRGRLGKAAHDWVREHRDARKTVHGLIDFYRRTIKEVHGVELAA